MCAVQEYYYYTPVIFLSGSRVQQLQLPGPNSSQGLEKHFYQVSEVSE